MVSRLFLVERQSLCPRIGLIVVIPAPKLAQPPSALERASWRSSSPWNCDTSNDAAV